MTNKNEVAETSNNFPTEMPAFLRNQGAGRGNEDVTIEDVAVPRISMLQDKSPQCKKTKDEYIEGAEPGMAYNTASQKLYGHELLIVPVYFRKEYLLWKHTDFGGGFKGSFPTMAEAEAARHALGNTKEGEKPENPAEYDSIETAQHFVLVVDAQGNVLEDAVISMAKSQLKASRSLNTQVKIGGGDRFSRVYKLRVVEVINANNQDYFNWAVTGQSYVNEPTFKAAEAMYESVKTGVRDVKMTVDTETGEIKPAREVDPFTENTGSDEVDQF